MSHRPSVGSPLLLIAALLAAGVVAHVSAQEAQQAPGDFIFGPTVGSPLRTAVTRECVRTGYPGAGATSAACEAAQSASPTPPAPAPVKAAPAPVTAAPAPVTAAPAPVTPAPATVAAAPAAVAVESAPEERLPEPDTLAEEPAIEEEEAEPEADQLQLEPEPKAVAEEPAPEQAGPASDAFEPEPEPEASAEAEEEASEEEAPDETDDATAVAPPLEVVEAPPAREGLPPSPAARAPKRAVVAVPPSPAPPAPPQRLTLEGETHFGFDKSELTPSGRERVDTLARALKATRFDQVIITGHSDRLGNKTYNQKLSARRAMSVKRYLTQHGIDASRIQVKSVGAAQPVTAPGACDGLDRSKTIRCLAPDRRVDVQVINARPR